MSRKEQAITELLALRHEIHTTEDSLERLRERFESALSRAKQAGVSPPELMRLLNVSRARLYQLLKP